MTEPTRFLLSEEQIPTHWVNLCPTSRATRCRR